MMQAENNKIKEIDLEILPKEVRIELVDFYEYLIAKYKKHKKVEKRERLDFFQNSSIAHLKTTVKVNH